MDASDTMPERAAIARERIDEAAVKDVGEVRRMCGVLEDELDRVYLHLDRVISKVDPVRAHRPSPEGPGEDSPSAMETEVGARLSRSHERVRALGGHLQELVDTIEV